MGFFTIALLLAAFPIIAIVALVKAINASDRLNKIEAHLAELEPRTAGFPGAAPAPAAFGSSAANRASMLRRRSP